MRIGIDLDGVVIDSESVFRVYEEIYAIDELNGSKIIDRTEPKYQGRYKWTPEEQDKFNKKYLLKGSQESNIMPGFIPVYKKLRDMGIEMVVITARGVFVPEMKDDALRLLDENNIVFDKYYWNVGNKLEICQKENIDIMIDDDYKIIKQISSENIKTIYFRGPGIKKLKENDYIHEVSNWGDIYRYFINLNK